MRYNDPIKYFVETISDIPIHVIPACCNTAKYDRGDNCFLTEYTPFINKIDATLITLG